MKTSISDYLNAYEVGGSAAVWTLVTDRCVTDRERRDEVDEIEAAGWFVERHASSDSAEGELDDAYFEPRTRRHA